MHSWVERLIYDVTSPVKFGKPFAHGSVVARHLFDALSAQYPNEYVTLVLPRNEADDVPDITVPKCEG